MLAPANNGYLTVQGMDRFDEINQMEDHTRWVSITWMSIKRTTADWKRTEYGTLRVVRGRVEPVVYVATFITGGPADVFERYATFDDMLDDGWRVD